MLFRSYARTTDGDAPECHIPPGDYDDGTYQGDEYKPYRDADYTLRWSDEPQGVDEVNCYEWVMSRSRTYDETDEVVKWSEFSTPGIFAKYGFNGKDGKDIEYVYVLTKTYEKPKVKPYDNTFPNGVGQADEFYPEIKWDGDAGNVSGNTVNGKTYWMDNAKDVTVDWPYQWEMIRKKTGVPQEENVNLYNYPWSEYTDDIVTLHSKWGRDGDQGRQGVAGVAGITYEMRYIRARHGVDPTTGLENDDIYLFVPNIVNGEFGAEDNNNSTPIFKEVLYVNEEGVEQDAWKQYWYNTIHPGTSTPLYKTRNLHKDYFPLYTDALSAEKEYPYMFFIQSRIVEDRVEETWVNPNNNQTEVTGYTSVEILENGEWEAPARLTGKQGIQGPRGNRGPILFSAGVYGMGKKYYTDDVRKPYVLDPADKEYYYLETGNYSPGATVNGEKDDKGLEFWYAYPDGNQHSKDNIPSKDSITDDPHWVKMEQFDVILANVGIFNSALVGSGVFYGEWFYSQNGLSGNTIVNNYEEFDPNTKINKGPSIAWGSENKFKPSLALNLKDGSGWFANQNIVWDSWGNMNCDVNGSFNSSGEGSLAGGAITWDADGLYIHKNTTFDDDVELKWGNINSSSVPNYLTQNYIDNAGYSQAEIEAFATKITKDTVTTPFVNALKVTADNVTANAISAHSATIGTIAAQNMDVDNLYVKKLNTKGKNVYSAGTISIEENEMKVFNNTKATEVVRITGTELKEIPNVVTGCTFDSVDCSSYNLFNDLCNKGDWITSSKYITDTSSKQPNDGYKYKVTNKNKQNVSVTIIVRAETTNFRMGQKVTLPISFYISNSSNGSASAPTSFNLFEDFGVNAEDSSQEWEKHITTYLNPTPGRQYLIWSIYPLSTGASDLSNVTISISVVGNSYQLTPDVNGCDISPLGFRYIVDHEKYAVFKKDGTFFLRSGDNGIGVDKNGCFITNDGKTLQKISISPEKEFRCPGNNIKGRVLMVGTYNAGLPST